MRPTTPRALTSRAQSFVRYTHCLASAEVRMIWQIVIGIVVAWLIIMCLQCLWPLVLWLVGVYFDRKG
jgi:hypothetical protein